MKRFVRRGLVLGGLAAAGRAWRRRDACILTYHNIVDDDTPISGDPSLHLRASRFAAHLDALSATHDVVSLEALREDFPDETGRTRPRVAITFDDAYQGAVVLGVEQLVAHGLPGTIFVAPDRLGRPGFWWDALAGGAPLAPEVRERALTELRGAESRIREWARQQDEELRAPGPLQRPATEQELAAAADHPRIAIASHSWSHVNLVRQPNQVLIRELEASMAWLRDRFDSFVPWLAYPYGLFSAHVEQRARAAGYVAAVRTRGGWLSRADGAYTRPRIDIPGTVSLDVFRLRTAGFFCPR